MIHYPESEVGAVAKFDGSGLEDPLRLVELPGLLQDYSQVASAFRDQSRCVEG